MITENDLHEAIAECQGTRDPNANTCLKLASYYTILDHIRKDEPIEVPSYSYASVPTQEVYSSRSEFGTLIPELDQYETMKVIDELMETLRILQPRLYSATMRKLTALKY